MRHLFASLPLLCHSPRLLASCPWLKALLFTPGHVGLLPSPLHFPILTEQFPAEPSAAATFHSETKHVLTASGIPRSSCLVPGAVQGQTLLTRCTSLCTTRGTPSYLRGSPGSAPSCACSKSPIPLWPSPSPIPHSPLEHTDPKSLETKSLLLWPRGFSSAVMKSSKWGLRYVPTAMG